MKSIYYYIKAQFPGIRRYLSVVTIIIFTQWCSVFTQTSFNNHGCVSNYGTIYIKGDLTNDNSAKDDHGGIVNSGEIHLTGNIVNKHDSLFSISSATACGKIIFCGNTLQKISGPGRIVFNKLVAKNDILLNRSITVLDSLNLEKGKVILDTTSIYLYRNWKRSDKGKLFENEKFYVDGKSGILKALENSNFCNNIGNLGFITENSYLGFTEIKRNNIPSSFTADGSIKRSFRVIPGQPDNAAIKLKYLSSTFDSTLTNEKDFKIWVSTDKVNYKKLLSQVNSDFNEIATTQNFMFDTIPYFFTIADENCIDKPIVSLGKDRVLCQGEETILSPEIINKKPGTYQFFWQGNFVSPIDSFKVNYSGPVTVTAIDDHGCFGSDTVLIRINPKPLVKFSLKNKCLYDSVFFNNKSTITSGFIEKYIWDFGDNSLSTDSDVMKKFDVAGSYSVKLKVISDKDCTDSLTKPLTIYPVPDSEFDTVYITEDIVQFTNNSPVSAVFDWIFPDTVISGKQVTFKFEQPGTFPVTLKMTATDGGCISSSTMNVKIVPPGKADFIITNGCEGVPAGIVNKSIMGRGSAKYFWMFGDGTTSTEVNPVHIYNNIGTYSISLKMSNGLGWEENVSKPITISALPKINFPNTVYKCSEPIVLKPEEKGISYKWSDGSNADTLVVTEGGTYKLIMENSAHCFSEDSVYVIKTVIEPNIGQDTTSCEPVMLDAGTDAKTYIWSNAAKTRMILVTESGQYSVIAENEHGCKGYDTVEITIKPKYFFSLGEDDTICSGKSVRIDISPESQTGYSCNWSDNTSGFVKDIKEPGTYIAEVINPEGCKSADTLLVTVNQSPNVNLGNDISVCPGFTKTLYAGVPFATYRWEHNGNIISNDEYISVSESGEYILEATLMINGCSDSDTISLNEVPAPIVNLGGDKDACDGDTVSLIPVISNKRSTKYYYLWKLNNEESFDSIAFINNTDSVFIKVTDGNGCIGADSILVQFNPLPDVNFSFENKCTYDSVNFKNLSSIKNGTINKAIWDFGDGNKSVQFNTSKKYSESGSYNVKLTVISDKGCSSSKKNNAIIYSVPDAKIETIFQSDFQVEFSNISSTSPICTWYFPNDTLTGNPVLYTFPQQGTYKVDLVANEGICFNSSSRNIDIVPPGKVSFNAENACVNIPVNIENNSTIGNGTASYLWTFGDGTHSIEKNPSHTYKFPGNYTIKLVMSNFSGWENSDSVIIEIYPEPRINFGSIISTCVDHFELKPEEPGIEYNWSDGSSAPFINVTKNGKYALTMKNEHCQASDSVEIILNSSVNPSLGNDTSVCGQLILDAHNPGSTYYWWNGKSDRNVIITESDTISVKVIDKNSCEGYDTIVVTVRPVHKFSLGNDTSLCEGDTIHLDLSPELKGYSGLWSDKTEGFIKDIFTSGTYWLSIINPENCSSTDTLNVQLNVSPKINLGNDTFVCGNFSHTLYAGNPYFNYTWLENGQITSREQSIIINKPGSYTLRAESNKGCSDTDTIIFKDLPDPIVTLGSDRTACKGETVTLLPEILNPKEVIYDFFWQGEESYSQDSFEVEESDTVIVKASYGNTCFGTDTTVIAFNPVPVVDFSTEKQCENDSIKFINNSSISQGSIEKTIWEFGDNTKSNHSDAVKKYATYGTYSVSLTAVSDKNCQNSKVKNLKIYRVPDSRFNIEYKSEAMVQFSDISKVASDRYWYVPGKILKDSLVTHVFSKADTYNIKLTLVSLEGNCTESTTKEVAIIPYGKAEFIVSDTCVNSLLNVSNKSTVGFGISTYEWKFGDGEVINELVPKKKFRTPGRFKITLKASNNYNWFDTITHYIDIIGAPNIGFEDTIYKCDKPVLLEPKDKGISYLWSDKSTGPNLTVTDEREYSLQMKNASGCSSQDKVVVINSAITSRERKDTSSCFPIVLSAFNNGNNYKWSNDDTSRQTLAITSGLYTVNISNIHGCSGAESFLFNRLETFNFSLGKDTTFCEGNILDLQIALPDTNYKCKWFDNSTNSTYKAASEGTYSAEVTTPWRCKSSASIAVNLLGSPKINLPERELFCNAINNLLKAGNPYAKYYRWSKGDSILSKDNEITITDTGTYKLVVVNTNGCSDSSTVTFDPAPYSITPDFLMPSEIDANDTAVFTQMSHPDPQFFYWEFGDGASSYERSPMHLYSYAGTFNVKLIVHNNSCDAYVIKDILVKENLKKSLKMKKDNQGQNKNIRILYSYLYPNPNNGSFKFDFSLNHSSDVTIYLFNIQGSIVDLKRLKDVDNYSLEMNRPDLRDGIYIIKLVTPGYTKSLKLIIKH